MYSNIKRSGLYKCALANFICNHYEIANAAVGQMSRSAQSFRGKNIPMEKAAAQSFNIGAVSITSAKRGFYGETWELNTPDSRYFIKLVYSAAHKAIYKRSFPIIQHLCDNGIEFISRIVKTKNGNLYAKFEDAILGVFEWIEGENIETDATKFPEYEMLAKVYTISPCGITIPREDFTGDSANKFFEQWEKLKHERICNGILSLFEKNRTKLEYRSERLKYFAEQCQRDTAGFVITHGDAGGNLIKQNEKHFIVDWDNPIFAPPERDAWVMCSRDWARDAFQEALRRQDIEHTLHPERLAYYCYYFFFFYLNAYLDAGTQAPIIEEYIDGWIERSMEYADGIL